MDQQKQEKLIQKIVESEIDKVKRESQQLLQAIQVESEEREAKWAKEREERLTKV